MYRRTVQIKKTESRGYAHLYLLVQPQLKALGAKSLYAGMKPARQAPNSRLTSLFSFSPSSSLWGAKSLLGFETNRPTHLYLLVQSQLEALGGQEFIRVRNQPKKPQIPDSPLSSRSAPA